IMHIPQASGRPDKRIGIQCEDDVSCVESVARLDWFAERQDCAQVLAVARDRLPAMPTRLWKPVENVLKLRTQRWRGYARRQEAESIALSLLQLRNLRPQGSEKISPGTDLTLVGHRL